MLILVLCPSVFSFLVIFTTYKSTKIINEVGTAYMANMSRQISMHFETTIKLRLAQLTAIVETVTRHEKRQNCTALVAGLPVEYQRIPGFIAA